MTFQADDQDFPLGGGTLEGLALPETMEEVTGEFDAPMPGMHALAAAADTLDRLQRSLQRRPDARPGQSSSRMAAIDPDLAALEMQLHNQIATTARAEERAVMAERERKQLEMMLARVQTAAEALVRKDEEAWNREQALCRELADSEARVEDLELERTHLVNQLGQTASALELERTAAADLRARAHATTATANFEQEMAMARQIIGELEAQCSRAEAKVGEMQTQLVQRTAQAEEAHQRALALRQQLQEMGVMPRETPRKLPGVRRLQPPRDR